MKSRTFDIYKIVFGYILFHQLVLEIYDLGKSLLYFILNQADLHIYIQQWSQKKKSIKLQILTKESIITQVDCRNKSLSIRSKAMQEHVPKH